MKIMACAEAAIVIPGSNLWRSTVVTLGGQKADLIEVLPDMSGIIARFSRVGLPEQDGEPTNVAKPIDLSVWTSEGHDTLTDRISILPPAQDGSDSIMKSDKCPDDAGLVVKTAQ